MLVAASLAFPSSPADRVLGTPPRTVNKFFYVVNESGSDVRVRVRAGGRDLLVEPIPGQDQQRPGVRSPPPADLNPARERKIKLTEETERLEVEEMISGRKATFEIGRAWMRGPGFRITIGVREIRLAQDYRPERSGLVDDRPSTRLAIQSSHFQSGGRRHDLRVGDTDPAGRDGQEGVTDTVATLVCQWRSIRSRCLSPSSRIPTSRFHIPSSTTPKHTRAVLR